MTTTKTANYTEAQEKTIIAAMLENTDHASQAESVLLLAAGLDKTVRSISAKMSSLSRNSDQGVTFYKKPTSTTKTGGKVERKSAKIEALAVLCESTSEKLDSLDKATKIALDIVIGTITRLQTEIDDYNSVDTLSNEELPEMLKPQAG